MRKHAPEPPDAVEPETLRQPNHARRQNHPRNPLNQRTEERGLPGNPDWQIFSDPMELNRKYRRHQQPNKAERGHPGSEHPQTASFLSFFHRLMLGPGS